ncbi:hypothetical protein TNIN_487381 [Trichonephila inaurata madagascariensis]|uniref:Innexin n=1 Tax=Trichonephila inaurata madagascariensis TaxID=2747483 RepID=A0A8X6XTX9_9ARAC|nr:hypothetical protein TNIN_487381 [Trichonephila inaurata madagascariensis]
MNPLYDSHALAQLLDNCWMNDTNGSTDSGLQRMSEVLKYHRVDAFTVDNLNMQSDFYPLVILLLLGQAISFHSIRLVWMLASYDDLYNLVSFIESSAFKRLNLRMNIGSVIGKIILHFDRTKCIFLLQISDMLCVCNIVFQNYAMEKFPGVNIASVFSLESSFNSNWTAECDYTLESHQVSKCSFRCHDSSSDLWIYDATCNFVSNKSGYSLYNYLKIYFSFIFIITSIKLAFDALIMNFCLLVFLITLENEELLQPYFICLKSIIYQCTPEKIFLLNSLCSNLDSPDIGNTVKELAKKVTEEHPIESDTYLFSISDPDEPV